MTRAMDTKQPDDTQVMDDVNASSDHDIDNDKIVYTSNTIKQGSSNDEVQHEQNNVNREEYEEMDVQTREDEHRSSDEDDKASGFVSSLSIEGHVAAMQYLKLQFKDIKDKQFKHLMSEADKRLKFIKDGRDQEYKILARGVEDEYQKRLHNISNLKKMRTNQSETKMNSEQEICNQSMKENKCLMKDRLVQQLLLKKELTEQAQYLMTPYNISEFIRSTSASPEPRETSVISSGKRSKSQSSRSAKLGTSSADAPRTQPRRGSEQSKQADSCRAPLTPAEPSPAEVPYVPTPKKRKRQITALLGPPVVHMLTDSEIRSDFRKMGLKS